MTSFRIVLINSSLGSLSQWKCVDIPIFFIRDEKFEGPFADPTLLTGKCLYFNHEAYAITNFSIEVIQGDLKPFEFGYKTASTKLKEQHSNRAADLKYQTSLAAGIYQLTEIKPLIKNGNCKEVFSQDTPYKGYHYLVRLMEELIPDITSLETGQKAVFPPSVDLLEDVPMTHSNSDSPDNSLAVPSVQDNAAPINEYAGNVPAGDVPNNLYLPAPNLIPIPPVGPVPPIYEALHAVKVPAIEYPEISYQFEPDIVQPVEDIYPKLKPILVPIVNKPPKPPAPVIPCGDCGKTSDPHNIVYLLCGHSIHSSCLSK